MKNVLKTLVAAAAIFILAAAPASAKAKEPSKTAAAKAAPVDINSASQKELEDLPGVGTSTAKKIVAGRPYSSVGDLSRAGVSARTIEKITPLVTVGAAAAATHAAAPAEKPAKGSRASAPAASSAPSSTAPVDLNSASQKDLEALPGVGASTAKKIVAGRPYATVGDLSRAGVSAKTIEKITPLVTVGAAAAAAAPAVKPMKASRASVPATSSASTAAGPVDLNSASQKDLEALPAVGAATAKKIIAGRPYSSVADLSKAGVSAKTIEKITPLVTVGRATAPAPSSAAPMEKPSKVGKTGATPPSSSSPAGVEARTPPAPGMVWVNTATKVFHRQGDPWYGKTKEGKFMTEAEATQAGYRASKQVAPKKP
jgi:competence protein ComEA